MVFHDRDSVQAVLSADTVELLRAAEREAPSKAALLEKVLARHALSGGGRPSRAALQREADASMDLFEREEAAEAERRTALRDGEPDEDGFITVTYKKKRTDNGDDAGAPSRKKKKKTLELNNFYRHQVRRRVPAFCVGGPLVANWVGGWVLGRQGARERPLVVKIYFSESLP